MSAETRGSSACPGEVPRVSGHLVRVWFGAIPKQIVKHGLKLVKTQALTQSLLRGQSLATSGPINDQSRLCPHWPLGGTAAERLVPGLYIWQRLVRLPGWNQPGMEMRGGSGLRDMGDVSELAPACG